MRVIDESVTDPTNVARQCKRREARFSVDEWCSVHVLNPLADSVSRARLLDVSRGGLKLRLQKPLEPGVLVHIGLKHASVLGNVRYCRPVGVYYDIGIEIEEMFPLPHRSACP